MLICTKSDSGIFTTESTWEWIQARGLVLEEHKWIWNNMLTKKFSVLMWKAWRGALAVDDKLRRIGIPLASKCDCRRQGIYEDQIMYSLTGRLQLRYGRNVVLFWDYRLVEHGVKLL